MIFIPTKKNALLVLVFQKEIAFYLPSIQSVKKTKRRLLFVLSVAEKQLRPKENDMKKKTNKAQPDDDMLPEYNLEGKKGVRGKYAKALQKGYSVHIRKEDGTVSTQDFIPKENAVVLDPDVKAYF